MDSSYITKRPLKLKKKPVKKKTTKKVLVGKDKRVGPSNELISTLGLSKGFVDKLKRKGINTLRDLTHYSPLEVIQMCGLSPRVDVNQLDKVREHLKKFGLRMKSSKNQEKVVDTRSLSSWERRRLEGPSFTVQFD